MLPLTDDLGNPRFNHKSIREAIYADNLDIVHMVEFEADEDINKFIQYADELGIDMPKLYEDLDMPEAKFDWYMKTNWRMPEQYKEINLKRFFNHFVDGLNKEEYNRVQEELGEFEARGLGDLLRYMIYLVDVMRANNIVWGVGRGSSVASFLLYLIGINRINPMKYHLDYREFLR